MKKIKFALGILLITFLVGCNLPQGQIIPSPDTVYTEAALTVQAALTQVAETNAPTWTPLPSPTPLASSTPIPTNTFVPTSTSTQVPCNAAKFIKDVTYPDNGPGTGPNVPAGMHFTKTWQLQNVGSCTWTSAYQLYFDSGDSMGGPASQTLTGGTVAPLQTVDISVDLIAPATMKTYTGYWKLRDPNGVIFGLTTGKAFWVTINVTTDKFVLSVNPVAAESTTVRSDGSMVGSFYVGDNSANLGLQTLLSFDISSIPTGSTVSEVKLDLSKGYVVSGSPFSLGCMYLYAQDYGTPDGGDFVAVAPAGGLTKLCAADNLDLVIVDDDVKSTVQSKIGTLRYQIRFQFPDKITNANAINDSIQLGTITLTITYKKP